MAFLANFGPELSHNGPGGGVLKYSNTYWFFFDWVIYFSDTIFGIVFGIRSFAFCIPHHFTIWFWDLGQYLAIADNVFLLLKNTFF